MTTRLPPLWTQDGSYAGTVDRRLIAALWPAGATSGMAVTPSSGMVLNISEGTAAVPSPNATGCSLCASIGVEQVTISAAPPSNSRIDVVTVHPSGSDLDSGVNGWIFDVIVGTAAASPAAPAVPAGQLAIARVLVPSGSATITAGNITDVRPGFMAVPNASTTPRYPVMVQRTTAFSLPATAGTQVVVPMNSVTFDPGGLYNTTTGLYTCPATGVYLISAKVSFTATAVGQTINAQIYRNGTLIAAHNAQAAAAVATIAAQSLSYQCNAGDTLAVWAGSSLANAALRLVNETQMTVSFVGPP